MSQKNVTFEYYRVYAKIYNVETNSSSEDVLFDITPILEKAYQIPANKRNYQINGEESRLQSIERDALNKNIWKMSFIRMRENVTPRNCKREWRV